MPFPTQLNWFKVKPSILVFGILNTESRKTSSPPLPSSAPWDGRRFAWLCSETKIREGAEHQRKVSHPHLDQIQSQVLTIHIVVWVENLLSDRILVYNPPCSGRWPILRIGVGLIQELRWAHTLTRIGQHIANVSFQIFIILQVYFQNTQRTIYMATTPYPQDNVISFFSCRILSRCLLRDVQNPQSVLPQPSSNLEVFLLIRFCRFCPNWKLERFSPTIRCLLSSINNNCVLPWPFHSSYFFIKLVQTQCLLLHVLTT